ncbi:hypothetical protein PROCOU_11568 [Listeria rocourtiae FSL F6-920]|nr:hypothetical protein PROCOU_11568 [Listeria rocourtiae FSL F6-920]
MTYHDRVDTLYCINKYRIGKVIFFKKWELISHWIKKKSRKRIKNNGWSVNKAMLRLAIKSMIEYTIWLFEKKVIATKK